MTYAFHYRTAQELARSLDHALQVLSFTKRLNITMKGIRKVPLLGIPLEKLGIGEQFMRP